VEIIIASIGLSLGVLSVEMFSIIVVMAVVTSIMAPVALRFTLARVETGSEEKERLAREDATRGLFTAGLRRMLVPVRPRSDVVGTQNIEAFISRQLAEANETVTTLFSVVGEGSKEEASAYVQLLAGQLFDRPGTSTRTVQSPDPIAAILEEASHDYDLMMIGTPAMSAGGSLFGPMLDDLVRLAPCPSIVVRGGAVEADWVPRKILVPVDGSPGSRKALELAFAVAAGESEVDAVYVQTPALSGTRSDFASDITSELQVLATQLDQRMSTDVVQASEVELGILRALEESGADMLVLGTSVRAGTSRLHLGPRVEYLARNAPCPVVILNT
jgi:nucleotide-binding universal stress UspA family protein